MRCCHRFISGQVHVRRNYSAQVKNHSFLSRKERFFRLAAMPPAGLLRDSPPEARLRIRRCAFICHRQRLAPDPRKATRGGVLWTPRTSGESKGNTRVAARAVRRGLEPRIPLTLNRTSDRDSPPLLHAARGNKNSKKPRHCEPVADVTGVVYALRVQSVSSWAADGVRPYKCRQHCGRWRDPP